MTAVRLADGKYRVNRWRLPLAAEHTQQIEDLWASQIGDNTARMNQLAAHLYLTVPWVTTNRILSALRKEKVNEAPGHHDQYRVARSQRAAKSSAT